MAHFNNKPRSISRQHGVLTMDKSEKLTQWLRFFFAIIISFGKMVADEFLYIFLRIKYFVMNGYVGQFARRTVTLQRPLTHVQ